MMMVCEGIKKAYSSYWIPCVGRVSFQKRIVFLTGRFIEPLSFSENYPASIQVECLFIFHILLGEGQR